MMEFLSYGHLLSLSRVKYIITNEADKKVSPDWVEGIRAVMLGVDASFEGTPRSPAFP